MQDLGNPKTSQVRDLPFEKLIRRKPAYFILLLTFLYFIFEVTLRDFEIVKELQETTHKPLYTDDLNDTSNIYRQRSTLVEEQEVQSRMKLKIHVFALHEPYRVMQNQYYNLTRTKWEDIYDIEVLSIQNFNTSEPIEVDKYIEDDYSTVYIFHYGSQLLNLHILLENINTYWLTSFRLKYNLCFLDAEQQHFFIYGKNEQCKSSMLIQDQNANFKNVSDLIYTSKSEGAFMNLQVAWAKPYLTDRFPAEYFGEEKDPWRPEILKQPYENCTAMIPTLIKTSIKNYSYRELFRKSFVANYENHTLQQYFVIGLDNNEMITDAILDEITKYDDIIIGNFIDSYTNLTFKTYIAHKFTNDYCAKANFILLHDDDAVIRKRDLIRKLSGHTKQKNFSCLAGYPKYELPMRGGKNGAKGTQYPIGHKYPPFCHGPCLAVTIDASRAIYNVSRTASWNDLGLEDVLFNGIMRSLANITNISAIPSMCVHVDLIKRQDGHLRKLTNLEKLVKVSQLLSSQPT